MNIHKRFLCVFFFLVVTLFTVSFLPFARAGSEAPKIQWQEFFDGTHGYSVLQTADGGYAVLGTNASSSLLIKTDDSGNLLWEEGYRIGGKDTGLPFFVQTKDGGYALAGSWENKLALVRVDSQGNLMWNKTYEYDAPINFFRAFTQTGDEGFAVVGVYMNDSHGEGQIWLVKTDQSGDMQWNKTIIGPLGNFASSIIQTNDGGYAIIDTSWTLGDFPSTIKIFKTDSNGNVQWNTTYGGNGKFYTCESDSGIPTKDGGYLIAGVSGEKTDAWIAWLIKTDSKGNIMWNMTYGGVGSMANSVAQTEDGGYVFAGILNGKEGWIVKTNAYGTMDWNLTLANSSFVGNSIEDFGKPIITTSDGGYVLTGTKNDMIWLAKMNAPVLAPSVSLLIGIVASVAVAIAAILVITILRKQRQRKRRP